jgi:glycosyltransferase involved in cell wall biosynthesis
MSAGRPLVSVCIPLYNGMPFIKEAVQSVLNQTLYDWELVITDDHSTDDAAAHIARFNDPRIRYMVNPGAPGPEGNWNACLHEARGRYAKLLCQDDLLHPDCLNLQVQVLEQDTTQKASLVTCARRIIRPDGKPLMTSRWKKRRETIPARDALQQIVRSGTNPVGEPCAVMFRTADWKRAGGFSASEPYVIDLDFWCKLLDLGDCIYLPVSLSDFRISSRSWSARLAGEHSRQYSRFAARIRKNHPGMISKNDLRIGILKSRLGAYVRQVIFRLACHGNY